MPRKPQTFVVNGVPYPNITAAARLYGVEPYTVHQRRHDGWTDAEALGIDPPPDGTRLKRRLEEHAKLGATYDDIADAARTNDLSVVTVQRRLALGLTLDEATSFGKDIRVTRPIRYKKTLYPNVSAFARAYRLTPATVTRYLDAGQSIQDCMREHRPDIETG